MATAPPRTDQLHLVAAIHDALTSDSNGEPIHLPDVAATSHVEGDARSDTLRV